MTASVAFGTSAFVEDVCRAVTWASGIIRSILFARPVEAGDVTSHSWFLRIQLLRLQNTGQAIQFLLFESMERCPFIMEGILAVKANDGELQKSKRVSPTSVHGQLSVFCLHRKDHLSLNDAPHILLYG